MVSLGGVVPIPATAEMAAADPNRRGWVEAQHLAAFLGDVYMEEDRFAGLLARVGPWFNSQLGCAIAL